MIFYSTSMRGFYSRSVHGHNMPDDVVEITHEQYEQLLAAQCEGTQIVPGADGRPSVIDPTFDTDEAIRAQIIELEAQVAPRRLREAVLGVDGGWLADIHQKIALLRIQLNR